MSGPLFIGWDVGGWNCDGNGRSRDAIVILDQNLSIVGTPWRGNLREAINAAATSGEWSARLLHLCGVELPADTSLTLAIDTPLGFPFALVELCFGRQVTGVIAESCSNPYLFRLTERRLFRGGRGPLSPVKDMIGSQATKGMHVLAKFAPCVERCGVWTDGYHLHVIETYPAACRRAGGDQNALTLLPLLSHDDLNDARVCALVAYLFAKAPHAFEDPSEDVPSREGWIWVPNPMAMQKLLTEETRLV